MRRITKTARFVPEKTVRKIKARLYLAGVTYEDIGKEAGVKTSTVWAVIGGFCKSARVMAAISKLLGDASIEKTWGKAA
jgi:hypothetical protein